MKTACASGTMPLGSDPLPAPEAEPIALPPRAAGKRTLLCALTTSLLLYLSYFPAGWGFLCWIALVPLLCLVRSRARPRWIYWSAYLSGLCFYLPAVQWMRVADPRMYFTWLALSFYCATYFPLCLLLVRKLDRRTRLPLALTLPAVWVALEYFRACFPFYCIVDGGFPWYLLAYSQHRFLSLIQIADVTGPYGISFLLVAVNALVFGWLYRVGAFRRLTGLPAEGESAGRASLAFQSAVALLAFTACLGYGSWRLGQNAFRPGPFIALLQTNVPQSARKDRTSPDEEERQKSLGQLDVAGNSLHHLAVDWRRKPALIVWPETSWPDEWDEIPADIARGRIPKSQLKAGLAAREARAHLLLGMNTNVWSDDEHRTRYNSAILVRPDGSYAGRYDKIHRVPFGEYIPLRELSFMNKLAPYNFDYSIASGTRLDPLPLGAYRFGVVICYEDTDSRRARAYLDPARDAKADFVVNISNDGWFDGTSEHEEHLAICRFRAIECRRSIVRSVNMGISAVIDGNGRVLAPELVDEKETVRLWELKQGAGELPVSRWGEFKKVPGVLFATVPLDDRISLYARFGDWLPGLCWLLLVGSLMYLRLRRPAAV